MKYYFNAIDIKAVFNTTISNGSEIYLQLPDKKDSVEVNLNDMNGRKRDLYAPKYAARDFNFNCVTEGDDMEDFQKNYFGIWQLVKKAERIPVFNDHYNLTLNLYYEKQTNLSPMYSTSNGGYAVSYTLQFSETNPIDNIPIVELVDDLYNVLVP